MDRLEMKAQKMSTSSESDGQVAEMAAQLTPGHERVVVSEWAGGIPQEMATLPQVRLGQRWFSSKQILWTGVVAGAAVLIVGILIARYLRTLPDVQTFVAQYPGTGEFNRPVSSGFPWWLRSPSCMGHPCACAMNSNWVSSRSNGCRRSNSSSRSKS